MAVLNIITYLTAYLDDAAATREALTGIALERPALERQPKTSAPGHSHHPPRIILRDNARTARHRERPCRLLACPLTGLPNTYHTIPTVAAAPVLVISCDPHAG